MKTRREFLVTTAATNAAESLLDHSHLSAAADSMMIRETRKYKPCL